MIGESGIVLRRRSALEQIDLAVVLLRADWRRIVVATLPAWVLASAMSAAGWWVHPWLGVAVGVLLARPAQLPALLAASDRVSGRTPDVSLSRTLSASLSVIGNGVVNLFVAALSTIVFVGPPIFWIRWTFAPEVLVLERPESAARTRIGDLSTHGLGEAISARVWQLAIEAWALLSFAMAGELLLHEVLQLGHPFGSWSDGDPTPFYVLGALAVQPLLSIVRFCAYLELRTQREGLDAWFAVYSASTEEGSP